MDKYAQKEFTRKYKRCSYCSGTDFLRGPEGGASVNILCANKDCRHWFNLSPFGMEDLHRVEPSEKEKEVEQKKREVDRKNYQIKIYNEGRDLYYHGHKSLACIKKENWHFEASADDLLRIAGFIDAFLKR